MSTVRGMFLDRDVEANFSPGGFTRIGEGHYRRIQTAEEHLRDQMARIVTDLNNPQESQAAIGIPTPTRLQKIAEEIRTMPYGDVVAMAKGCGTEPGKLWDWAVGLK